MAARTTPQERVQYDYDIDLLPSSRAEAAISGSRLYFTSLECRHGHREPRLTRDASCIGCRRMHRQRNRHQPYRPENWETRRNRGPAGLLLQWARRRARIKRIEISITLADIVVPENCPCCGTMMTNKRKPDSGRSPSRHSPSLDRLRPDHGYVPGNVAVICFACNTRKGPSSLEELKRIVSWLGKALDQ